jgi:DDE superfamily endonuclease
MVNWFWFVSVFHLQKARVKTIAPKGSKSVGQVSSCERGKLVTMICCFSASGHYVPPLFVFPMKRQIQDRFLALGPSGSVASISKNGWTSTEIFTNEWLPHFVLHSKPSETKPILLILDGHSSHISVKIIDYCKNNHILLLTLPPHTSHKLQPLDLGFFSPLKSYYSQEILKWMRNHKFERLNQSNIPELMKGPYNRAATVETAVNSFEKSGIWTNQRPASGPNRNVFSGNCFVAAEAFGYERVATVAETLEAESHMDDVIDLVARGECSLQHEVREEMEFLVQDVQGNETIQSQSNVQPQHEHLKAATSFEVSF